MAKKKVNQLEIWEVTNQTTGKKAYTAALSPQDACEQAGWIIEDCFVYHQKPRKQTVKGQGNILLVRIPCLVCPFQYTECLAPAFTECPVTHDAPTMTEWLKQVATAHLCDYVGQDLSWQDHNLRHKWLPMEQAIDELARTS